MASKKNANDLGKLAKHVGECRKLVGKSIEILGAYAPMLSIDERRRLPKARRGGETIVSTIARLGKEHGLDLSGRSIDAMSLNIERAQAFAPLREALVVCLQMVDDAILANSGEAWQTATLVYTMLRRLAKTNKTLAVQIAPLTEFFALGPRTNASAKPKSPRATKAKAATPAEPANGSANADAPNGADAVGASIGHA